MAEQMSRCVWWGFAYVCSCIAWKLQPIFSRISVKISGGCGAVPLDVLHWEFQGLLGDNERVEVQLWQPVTPVG